MMKSETATLWDKCVQFKADLWNLKLLLDRQINMKTYCIIFLDWSSEVWDTSELVHLKATQKCPHSLLLFMIDVWISLGTFFKNSKSYMKILTLCSYWFFFIWFYFIKHYVTCLLFSRHTVSQARRRKRERYFKWRERSRVFRVIWQTLLATRQTVTQATYFEE